MATRERARPFPCPNPSPGSGGSAETKDHSKGRAAFAVRGGHWPRAHLQPEPRARLPTTSEVCRELGRGFPQPSPRPLGRAPCRAPPRSHRPGEAGRPLRRQPARAARQPVPRLPTLDPPAWPRPVLPFRRRSVGGQRALWVPRAVCPQALDGKCQPTAREGQSGSQSPRRRHGGWAVAEPVGVAGRPSRPRHGPPPPASAGTPPGTPLAGTHLLVHVGVNPLLAL